MVRKLTSLPVIIMLVVAITSLPMLLTAAFHPSLGVIFGVLGPVAFWLTAAIMVRGRRATAWLRGKVPWEYRNAPTAWALITEAETTPERINNQQVMRFRMKVYAPEGEFDSVMHAVLPVYPANQFQTGEYYPVRYLPGNHSEVAYDTTSAARNLGPKPSPSVMADPGVAVLGSPVSPAASGEPNFIVDEGASAASGYEQYPPRAQPRVTPGLAQPLPAEVGELLREMFADRLPGTAEVKAQRVTGQTRGMLAETELDLTITPQSGAAFDTTITKWIPAAMTARFAPGTVLDVLYSPGSPTEVAIQLTTVTSRQTDLLG